MSKPKYKQGKQIHSISEFETCESHWYKWNGKTRHREVLISLQYRTLLNMINSGRLYTAELIDKTESEVKDNKNKPEIHMMLTDTEGGEVWL